MDEFGKVSGLKLNPGKCTILKIGSLKNSNIHFLNERSYKWTSSSAKALGVTFTTDKTQLLKLKSGSQNKRIKKMH